MRTTSGQEDLRSDNILPPLRMVVQNISPPPLQINEHLDHSAQISMLEVRYEARLNCRPPPVHHSRSTEDIVHTFNDNQSQSLLIDEDTRSRLARRQFHHSRRPYHSPRSHHSPRSPHSPTTAFSAEAPIPNPSGTSQSAINPATDTATANPLS